LGYQIYTATAQVNYTNEVSCVRVGGNMMYETNVQQINLNYVTEIL